MKRLKKCLSLLFVFCFLLSGCGNASNVSNMSDAFSLKNMCFVVEKGSELSTDPSMYVDAVGDVLENLVFDFSQVDVNENGMYYATVSDGEDTYSFVVDVEDDVADYDVMVMAETLEPEFSYIENITIYSPENGKLTVSWNKVDGASGYEIYQAGKENGKFTQIQTINNVDTTTTTYSWLSSSRTYYFKVRAFYSENGTKEYGEYSNVVSQAANVSSNVDVVTPSEDTNVPTETVPPTVEPTVEPTKEPTVVPTTEPTQEPTVEPTQIPTTEPTKEPTVVPTNPPTQVPTETPIEPETEINVPTVEPTKEPTTVPTIEPTKEPTQEPTQVPTVVPTTEPTKEPTVVPTTEPTNKTITTLAIGNVGTNNIELSWDKIDVDGYQIYCSIGGNAFQQLATVTNNGDNTIKFSYLAKRNYVFKIRGYVLEDGVKKFYDFSNEVGYDFSTSQSTSGTTTTPTVTPTITPTKEPTVAPTETPTVTPTPTTPIETQTETSVVNDLIAATNASRTSVGQSELAVSATLTSIAQYRANHMVKNDYFSHYYEGKTQLAIARDLYGYSATRAIGENIGKISNTTNVSTQIMDAWKNSSSHYSNMTNSRWTSMGIGVARLSDGTWIMVQVFGE